MNLATMLQTPIKDLPPSRNQPKRVMDDTEERYKKVLSQGLWLNSVETSESLGLAYRTAAGTLRRYEKAGLIERRPRGGEFSNRHGWEYRWLPTE